MPLLFCTKWMPCISVLVLGFQLWAVGLPVVPLAIIKPILTKAVETAWPVMHRSPLLFKIKPEICDTVALVRNFEDLLNVGVTDCDELILAY